MSIMLTGKYLEFYNRLLPIIPKEQMFCDPLTTLAFGTDASFYRLVPKIVIRATNVRHVRNILFAAHEMEIPVTFRAAGTSLSGQSISDSVLVVVSHGFEHYSISTRGERITLEPGIRGARANQLLAKFGKKIGPDPASIDSAMIGGIAANNASGMCCGTSQNSYKTVSDINIILPDGTSLNTADGASAERFKRSHSTLIEGIIKIRDRITGDPALCERIERKYKIKNTTGYSLNAFVDFHDPIDIIKHLIIGSEGTLAFINDITYNTVVNYKFKALSLAIYPTIAQACNVVQVLKQYPVSAVELIDRASIKSVENADGVPEYLKTLPEGACGLLIEIAQEDKPSLMQILTRVTKAIESFTTILPLEFTQDAKTQAILWKVRKECLPTVAGMRKAGTTAIIEDICFPVPRLAEAVTDLRELFDKDGYSEAVLFGHALAGNLHFMFNQDFSTPEQINKYARLMDDVAELVVKKYDGSLKAEHGTGRNMAPFVEKEWGEQAYSLMKEIKQLFDPKGILNPGVIINTNPKAHISNLKPCPQVNEMIDKCMECGFCEKSCVTEGLTFSPRQRVVAFREISRLQKEGGERAYLGDLLSRYKYLGEKSCATDSLCALACPVKIDNGKLTKELRKDSLTPASKKRAAFISSHMNNTMWWARAAFNTTYIMRNLFGKKAFGGIAGTISKISGGVIPQWNEHFPKGGGRIEHSKLPEYQKNKKREKENDSKIGKVVYFPSCITRSMGTSKATKDAQALTALTHKLIEKAGFQVIYPEGLKNLCCGMAFSSKGFVESAHKLSDALKEALITASENGKYPILCDMSPCLYTMKSNYADLLPLYEPAQFAKEFLIPNLTVNQLNKSVAVWAVCSSKKMGVDSTIVEIAKLCAKKVTVLEGNCCGFAGDKGFFDPEINDWGLRDLKKQTANCTEGYATSRTCEIGLSKNSGIPFKNLLYLLDEASN